MLSKLRPSPGYVLTAVGGESHRLSPKPRSQWNADAKKVRSQSHETLNLLQAQLVLGTMLGDGSMRRNRHASYTSNHGWVQREYNWIKYLILSEYVSSKPIKRKNDGYGEWSSRFHTLSHLAFDFAYSLCHENEKKVVTPAWLSAIEEIGIWDTLGWWLGDDGSINAKTHTMSLHTEGFTLPEVQLLSQWLESHLKTPVCVQPARSSTTGKLHHRLRLSVKATEKFVENVAQAVPEPMKYKVTLNDRETSVFCHWCGKEFQPQNSQAREKTTTKRCCQSPTCIRMRHLELNAQLMAKPGKRSTKNKKQQEAYHADIEKSRERGRIHAAKYQEANRDLLNARKRAVNAKKTEARKLLPWSCQRCTLTEPMGSRDSKTKYCAECRSIVTRENQLRSRPLASSRSSAQVSTRFTTSKPETTTRSSPGA